MCLLILIVIKANIRSLTQYPDKLEFYSFTLDVTSGLKYIRKLGLLVLY